MRRRVSVDRKVWLPLAILAAGAVGVAALVLTRPRVEPAPPTSRRRWCGRCGSSRGRCSSWCGPTAPSRRAPRAISFPRSRARWCGCRRRWSRAASSRRASRWCASTGATTRSTCESARAVVARAQSEYDRATKELERQKRLADRSVASESRIDDAENADRAAAAALREAEARLERAERDLERTEMRAPYAGRVRAEQVDVGQFVTRGTSIGDLYAVDYAEVRLPMPDRELGFVDLPMPTAGPEPLRSRERRRPPRRSARRFACARSSPAASTRGPGASCAPRERSTREPHGERGGAGRGSLRPRRGASELRRPWRWGSSSKPRSWGDGSTKP